MRKYFFTILLLAFAGVFIYSFVEVKNKKMEQNRSVQNINFYSLSIKTLDGSKTINFSQFKGKKVLLVNVASECGYTPQYKTLQELHNKYKDKLVVIGFPCNQFGGQEPGAPKDIATFCEKNYGVTFMLTEKIDVKGSNQHAVYQWLTQKSLNGVSDANVKWNFNKFLVDENGKWLEYFGSGVDPLSENIVGKL